MTDTRQRGPFISSNPSISELPQSVGGKPVYRRDVTRADGRTTFFYGYTPHRTDGFEEPLAEVAKGGELRWHPLRQEWNVYAPHRQNRTFKPSAANDPLAPSRDGAPLTDIPFPEFELCVFENRFTSLHRNAPVPQTIPGQDSARAIGHCDVVVYTPEQTGNLWTVGQDRRRLLLAAWIDRYQAQRMAGDLFTMPFESRGEEVGVTLSHPHGQIYSFPFIPNTQARAAKVFRDGFDLGAEQARHTDTYRVASRAGVHAWCPAFARYPFETWVLPERKVPGPWAMTEDEQDGFAHLLGEVTARMDHYFERETAYMLSLQAAPVGTEADWHFWAQFYPILRAPDRVKYLASVEQHSGVFTVDVMPEFAAATLREQDM